jgi:hypothetical protein
VTGAGGNCDAFSAVPVDARAEWWLRSAQKPTPSATTSATKNGHRIFLMVTTDKFLEKVTTIWRQHM